MRRKNLSGIVVYNLTVLKMDDERSTTKQKCWVCLCACGKKVSVAAHNVGITQSCGCVPNIHHYRESKKPPREVLNACWYKMIQRCYVADDPSFPNYGGRGIKVCERWLNSFQAFVEDMGNKPGPEYSIDRKDNDGDYSPQNCRWATYSSQIRNQRPRKAVK